MPIPTATPMPNPTARIRSICPAQCGRPGLRLIGVVDYFCFGFTKRDGYTFANGVIRFRLIQ
jgi:hypothetical protein